MSSTGADPSYRAISIIALIQVGIITAGTLFIAVMLKARGYGSVEVPDAFFIPNAVFVRRSGFLLLLFPVVWALSAAFIARKRPDGWAMPGILLLGIGGVVFGIYAYVMLGLAPTVL
jgi:hypothetical protein